MSPPSLKLHVRTPVSLTCRLDQAATSIRSYRGSRQNIYQLHQFDIYTSTPITNLLPTLRRRREGDVKFGGFFPNCIMLFVKVDFKVTSVGEVFWAKVELWFEWCQWGLQAYITIDAKKSLIGQLCVKITSHYKVNSLT